MKYFGWIFLFFILVYIVPLGSRPMVIPDESRYSEIPREMLETGDYTTPRLLGLRYFEKPPMQYWLTAGSFKLFGENLFASRLPSAVAVGITALLISLLVQQALRDDKLAQMAAILYLTCGLVYGVGITAVTDNVFTMFVTGSHGLAFLAIQEKRLNWRKLLLLTLCGLFIGAAFLTKGFLAFAIPGMTVFAYLLWTKRWKEFLIMPWPILIFAGLVILPWGLAIHRAQPDFWRYFVVVEHFQRAAGGEIAQHAKPWWYFLPTLAIGALPASLLLPPALVIGKEAWKKIFKQEVYIYALIAFVLPFVFFSIAHGKLPTYILPCFPPAVLLLAAGVQAYFNVGGHHRAYNCMMNAWGILLFVAGIAGIVGWILRDRIPARVWEVVPVTPTVMITGGVAMLCGGMVLIYSLRGNWRGRLYMFFFGLALLPLAGSWSITANQKMPEATINGFFRELEINPKHTLVVTNGGNSQVVAWCCRKSDVRLFSLGELKYGNEAAIAHGEPPAKIDMKELKRHLADPKRTEAVAVILKAEDSRWNDLPPTPKSRTEREMSCRYYPGAAAK